MAGDRETAYKGELFDLLSEGVSLQLTAITRVEWGAERSLADSVLFAIADGHRPVAVAEAQGISVQKVWALLRKANDSELLQRARNTD